jgi:hypothetical protein
MMQIESATAEIVKSIRLWPDYHQQSLSFLMEVLRKVERELVEERVRRQLVAEPRRV